MKYIGAEEFLKQPKEVQKVFIDWWKPSVGDLVLINSPWDKSQLIDVVITTNKNKEKDICGNLDCFMFSDVVSPLFTLQQLIGFIEDKTYCILDINIFEKGYEIDFNSKENINILKYRFNDLGHDLLQAVWKVSCDIAKECSESDTTTDN